MRWRNEAGRSVPERDDRLPHLLVLGRVESEDFRRQGGGSSEPREVDRRAHGERMRTQLDDTLRRQDTQREQSGLEELRAQGVIITIRACCALALVRSFGSGRAGMTCSCSRSHRSPLRSCGGRSSWTQSRTWIRASSGSSYAISREGSFPPATMPLRCAFWTPGFAGLTPSLTDLLRNRTFTPLWDCRREICTVMEHEWPDWRCSARSTRRFSMLGRSSYGIGSNRSSCCRTPVVRFTTLRPTASSRPRLWPSRRSRRRDVGVRIA